MNKPGSSSAASETTTGATVAAHMQSRLVTLDKERQELQELLAKLQRDEAKLKAQLAQETGEVVS